MYSAELSHQRHKVFANDDNHTRNPQRKDTDKSKRVKNTEYTDLIPTGFVKNIKEMLNVEFQMIGEFDFECLEI